MDTPSSKIKKHLSKKDKQLMDQAAKKDLEDSVDLDVLNCVQGTASNPIILTSGWGCTFNNPGNNFVITNYVTDVDPDTCYYEGAKSYFGQEKLLKLVLKDYLSQGKKIEALCIALRELKD